MKIDICSDLHVDAWHHETKIHTPGARLWMGEPLASTWVHVDWWALKNPDSRVLVIAGDISNNLLTSLDVLEAAADAYEYVVVVDGNHEHYGNSTTVQESMTLLEKMLHQYPNVYYLKHDVGLVVDKVAFLGTSAWYDFKAYEDRGIDPSLALKAWNSYSNDSRYPKFGLKYPEVLAEEQARGLADQVGIASIDDAIDNIVVVTHTSPRADLMEWRSGDIIWNSLTPSYVNTQLSQVVDADVEKKISHWIYGHTHERQICVKDGIQYINNARGYPKENLPFSLIQMSIPAK